MFIPLSSLGAAARAPSPVLLHLRRATFDPLQRTPTLAVDVRGDAATRLRLMQFDAPPNAQKLSQMRARGLHPLAYVPAQALIVRVADGAQMVSGLRWSGPFAPAYKLSTELDAHLHSTATLDLNVLPTPDADPNVLATAITAAGGVVQRGTTSRAPLRAQMSGVALRTLIGRDDVLWVEPFITMRVQADKARAILGVPQAQARLGLDGTGQIVAVTDTGLDVQENMSADFAGRVVRGFSREEMEPGCAFDEPNTWSDLNGHGTHVSGIVLGSGTLSNKQYAGIAPSAQLVTQAVSDASGVLYCLPNDASFMQKAYDAGARIQNASWGGPTGSSGASQYGAYTALTNQIDEFIWAHPEHLFVTVAGNEGRDANNDGVVDDDTLDQPGTAKNVLTVGASENDRAPTGACSGDKAAPQNICWGQSAFLAPKNPPFADDFVSDNASGLAAFSSRGPTNDGRIKPEIVAPGTSVISSRSHHPSTAGFYQYPLNGDYAYQFGTSFSAPMISGMAALVRQWLAAQHRVTTPSAALLKALLLNGATNIAPGQYGTGAQREIPAAWPNSAQGWGRASLTATVGLDSTPVWFADEQRGIAAAEVLTYTINVSTSQPLRATLVWADPPATPNAERALVNDLDLEVQAPDGIITRGNVQAGLSAICRDIETNADRCNNAEAIEIAAQPGSYRVQVRGHAVSALWSERQPFALAVSAATLGTPTLDAPNNAGRPDVTLHWSAVTGATRYEVQQRTLTGSAPLSATFTLTDTLLSLVMPVGRYTFAVRACDTQGCGTFSSPQAVEVRGRWQIVLPLVRRAARL